MFIVKLDSSGMVDTAFGVNGVAIVNFVPDDYDHVLNDLVFESDGRMYCTGTQYPTCCTESPKLIYFKVTPNGNVDYTFDGNGYRTLTGNNQTYGNKIIPYLNGFY